MGKIVKKQKLWKIMTSVFALLMVIVVIGTYVASSASSTINQVLGTSDIQIKNMEDTIHGDSAYYASSYDTVEDLVNEEYAFIEDVQQEGSVLLKNDGALPLAENNLKVSCFNRASTDMVYAGTGTGSLNEDSLPTLKDALEASGVEVNTTLWDFYKSKTDYDLTNLTVGEVPVSEYTDEVKASFADYHDAAIVVISRIGGEDGDLAADSQYLELSDEEREVMELVSQNFDKIIVLVNSSNAVSLNWLDEYNVNACLWIGGVGQTGMNAVADILTGERNPSGKLADTYAANSFSAPAMMNFPSYGFENREEIEAVYGDDGAQTDTWPHSYYTVEAEGIYVGYRYYETRYEDCVLNQGNAASEAGTYESDGNWEYAKEICFPFGYGLSYTTFEQKLNSVKENGDSFTVNVTVTNTGDVAGKDVVEVYYQSPYTQYDVENKIEKSAVELGGFAKTSELAPGQSENVEVTVEKEDMTSYDANGFGTYILEAGEYYLSIGNGAHEAINNILAAKGKNTEDGMDGEGNAENAYSWMNASTDSTTYAVSSATGNEIQNQFADSDLNYYEDGAVTYLSRSDWEGTYPVSYDAVTATEDMITALGINYESSEVEGDITVGKNGDVSLIELRGLDYDDPLWDDLLDQLTYEEISDLIGIGGYQVVQAVSINFIGSQDTDGPLAINSILKSATGGTKYTGTDINCTGYNTEPVIASTWNTELARRMGEYLGEDGIWSGYSGLYGPGANTHRTPYSGRNYEYYSEDAFLAGEIGASEVSGATSKGMRCFVKHFAMNDMETHRHGLAEFNNEQAIREIYLAAFEKLFTEGKALAVMTSFNRIGCTWAAAQEGLMTGVLRNEWGFNGTAVTDAAMMLGAYASFMDYRTGLVAGNDMWLSPSMSENSALICEYIQSDKALLAAARQACHRILYSEVNSAAMNGVTAETTVRIVTPVWQMALYIAIAVLGALTVLNGVLVVLAEMKTRKQVK